MKTALKNKQLWATVLITGLSLYFALNNISWQDVIRSFRAVQPLWLIPSVIMVLLGTWVRGIRWASLFNEDSPFSTIELSKVVVIGYMFNNLFPARLGEIVRVYLLGREKRASRTMIFSTIVTERIYDVVSLFLCLGFFFIYLRLAGIGGADVSGMMVQAEKFFLILLPFFLVGFAIVIFWPHILERILAWVIHKLPRADSRRAGEISASFMEGLEGFRNPKMAFVSLFWALLSWILITLSNYFIIRGLPFNQNLSFDIALGLAAVIGVNFAMVLPATPGYVGIYEAAVVASLTMFGIDKSQALAFAFIAHAIAFLPVNLAGWYFLVQDHLGLRELATAVTAGGLSGSIEEREE